jgi:hypothetical protein
MVSQRLPLVASIVSLAAVGFACGASDSGGTGGTPGSTTPASTVQDLGGQPCTLVTKFPGDSQCITAPSPEAGLQFHYGPTNYNDPVEVGKYTLAPGGEVTDCTFFVTPNKDTVYFSAYHSRMRPGSHHMLLYVQPMGGSGPTIGDNGLQFGASANTGPMITGSNGPSACNQGLATRNLFGAQTPNLDVDALTAGAVENNGLAVDIPAQQQGVMQAHFINATSGPLLREVWANILFVPKDQVTQLGDPIFFLGGLGMDVPMGSSQAITGHATVPDNVAPDFRLVIGTGHYHSHTTEFKAWATVSGQQFPIIHDYNTLGHAPDPATWYFDSAKQNPVANDATQAGGAYSGILHMQPGDTIDWECDVTNNNVPGGIKFANAVYTGEMCNMFGMYVPSFGGPWEQTNF